MCDPTTFVFDSNAHEPLRSEDFGDLDAKPRLSEAPLPATGFNDSCPRGKSRDCSSDSARDRGLVSRCQNSMIARSSAGSCPRRARVVRQRAPV